MMVVITLLLTQVVLADRSERNAELYVPRLVLQSKVRPHVGESNLGTLQGSKFALNVSALLQRRRDRRIEADRYVLVRGAYGINADAINGDYKAMGMYNGKTLFLKENDENCWLRFVLAKGLNQWRISSTESLRLNNDLGYMYSADRGLDDPADARRWFVWAGSGWEPQDSVVAISEGYSGPPAPESEPLAAGTEGQEQDGASRRGARRAKSRGLNADTSWQILHLMVLLLLASLPTALGMWALCAWRAGKDFPLALSRRS